MTTNVPATMVALALLALGNGCATTAQRATATVPLVVEVDPPEATVKVMGVGPHVIVEGSPGVIQVPHAERTLVSKIVVEAPGYEPQYEYVRFSVVTKSFDPVSVKLLPSGTTAAQKEARLMSIPALTDEQRQLLREGRVAVGMPPAAVEHVWGRPRDRIVSGGVGGSSEWLHYNTAAFYFVDGRLVRWTMDR